MMCEKTKQNRDIDAVITWVDGNDPGHIEKRQQVLSRLDGTEDSLPTGQDNTRFIDNGELKFCIESIRRFAPWIRNIHIITDSQIPAFATPAFRKENRINIVDHTEIFASYEWALPCFNSRTIETALWRISGLAPRFIYFNDDFILTRPVHPEDFFSGDKVVLRGSWKPITSYGSLRMKMNHAVSLFAKHIFGITRSMHHLLQIRSAQLAGFGRLYFRTPHVPHPLNTATLRNYFHDHPGQFEKNIRYRFRNMEQFSAIHLAHHLEINKHNAILNHNDDVLMINGEIDLSYSIKSKLRKIEEEKIRFLCLQGFEKINKKQQYEIENTLYSLLDPDQGLV